LGAWLGRHLQPNLCPNEDYSKHSGSMEWDIDRPGLDYNNFDLPKNEPALCMDACQRDQKCKAWTYVKPNTTQGVHPRCWLKYDVPSPESNVCCISGVRYRAL